MRQPPSDALDVTRALPTRQPPSDALGTTRVAQQPKPPFAPLGLPDRHPPSAQLEATRQAPSPPPMASIHSRKTTEGSSLQVIPLEGSGPSAAVADAFLADGDEETVREPGLHASLPDSTEVASVFTDNGSAEGEPSPT